MKQTRLDELMLKCSKNELTINELGEICGALLQSFSRHSNDIKQKIFDIDKRIQALESKLEDAYRFQPAFGIISDMDEDQPDQD